MEAREATMHSHQHPHPHRDGAATLTGYCVKCQASREMRDPKQIERGGGPAIEGNCIVCGTRMFIMGGELSAGDS